jgi:hypothetical protein
MTKEPWTPAGREVAAASGLKGKPKLTTCLFPGELTGENFFEDVEPQSFPWRHTVAAVIAASYKSPQGR